MWKAPSRTRIPAATLIGSWRMPRSAAKGAEGLGASEQRTASPATTGPSAAVMASAPRSGSTASAVWPARSRAISAGTCSAERPRLLARSPRRRGPRPGGASPRRHRREPLWERRKKVSSASTTPPRASRAAAGARRKRCRQRKLVGQVHAAVGGRLGQRHPGRERLAVAQPAGLLAQPRQGGAGERVEGLVAGLAPIAAQPAGVAPALQPRRGTVRAARGGGERLLQQPHRLGLAPGRRQGPPERRPLLPAEPLDQVQQHLEIRLAHRPPRRHHSTGSLPPNNQREKSLLVAHRR